MSVPEHHINRLAEIDVLRAIGIIFIMITHVYSFHLGNPVDYAIWNNIHFVVVGFVFASGYVLARRYGDTLTNLKDILKWYKKRVFNLLQPLYIYLLIHYAFWILFPDLFSGLGLKKDFTYIWQSLIFYDGLSLNWIVLLFIQLTLLFPFFMWAFHKKRVLFWIFIIAAAVFTAWSTAHKFPVEHYRSVMWVGWSLIFMFGSYMSIKEKNSRNNEIRISFYFKIGTLALAVYTLLWVLFDKFHISHQLVDHKYPPNFFYLSYGVAAAMGMLAFMKITRIHTFPKAHRISTYLSRHSYALYFVHYIMLDMVIKNTGSSVWTNNPIFQSALLILLSLIGLSLTEKIGKKLISK